MDKYLAVTFLFFILARLGYAVPAGHPCNPPPREDEITINPIDIDTASFMAMMKRISEGLDYIPNKPIKYTPGKGVKIKVEVKTKEICCDSAVTVVQKYKGSATVDVGSIGGTGPVPYLYYPGIGGFTMSVSMGLSSQFSIASEYPTCDEDGDACGSISVIVSGSGGITGLIVDPDILSVKGAVNIDARASAAYCIEDGLKDQWSCAIVKVDVTGKALWTSFTICQGKTISNNC